MQRRAFLKTLVGGGMVVPWSMFALSGNRNPINGPLTSNIWPPLSDNTWGYAGLATSLIDEADYEPRIQGTLPEEIRGCLYRNGPALFDRGPHRKRMILDGEGTVQYRNRFVKTPKYLEEQSSKKFIYPTWATPIDGGRRANRGLDAPNTGTEPVFVPRPDFHYQPGSKDEPGWLLTLVYDDDSKKSSLSVLEADHLDNGPLARVELRHHVPMSLHGYWYPLS